MPTFNEGYLRFEFGNGWVVSKYDEHPFYRNRMQKLPNTTAVDFVGVQYGSVYLIEVKDFRGHRIENKARDLAVEVAYKVRDSIAGLVGAQRDASGPHADALCASAQVLLNAEVRVVLWLEEDTPVSTAARRSALAGEVKKYLRWLKARVIVVNVQENQDAVPALAVANLPGAGQP